MEAVTAWAKPDARIVPTSGMHLDQIVALMRDITSQGGIVARVHSGDPSLYGATHEQIAALEAAGVPYEIVPGVTVAFAAAAHLQAELTVPEVTQTIILTRVSQRIGRVWRFTWPLPKPGRYRMSYWQAATRRKLRLRSATVSSGPTSRSCAAGSTSWQRRCGRTVLHARC
jgi:hypothetical protein